jgi:hypothetical protein
MVTVMRGILVFGCAAAFAAAPLIVAAPASACPYGTSERFPGVCTNGQSSGGFGAQGPVVIPQAAPPTANFVPNPNGFSTVNGIPCTPENYGKCIGLMQSQG